METTIARKTLAEMREKLITRVGRIEAHIRRDGEPLNQDSEEAVVEKENDAVLDGLDAQERKELSDIEHALARIASGQYHVCSKCGATISEERLTALPYATTCVQCG